MHRADHGAQTSLEAAPNGFPASHPDASGLGGHRVVSGSSDRSPSPLSRTNTPGLSVHNPNIAPQHIFDNLTEHAFQSSSLPSFALRHPSPSASSINGAAHLEAPHAYGDIAGSNGLLKTRVSELEVINDLFRGRVAELEQSEQEARRNETIAREAADRYQADLVTSIAREADMKRRLEEVEAELDNYRASSAPAQKRLRLSDVVQVERSPTPTPAVLAVANATAAA